MGVSKNLALGDGWDDLPSDSEDLFFFSLDEAEDIRREKRRRLMESNRETRMLAMKAATPEEQPTNDWGGSDEEVCSDSHDTRIYTLTPHTA